MISSRDGIAVLPYDTKQKTKEGETVNEKHEKGFSDCNQGA
jgi:hypothetical protein